MIVSVPVAVDPPVREELETVNAVITGAVIVRMPLTRSPESIAVTVASKSEPTGIVVTGNVVVVAPAGKVKEAGPPHDGDVDENETLIPPEGEAELILRVPVEIPPPCTLVGLKVSSVTFGGSTLRFAEAVLVPSVALIVVGVTAATGTVVTVNVAELAPAATGMEAGRVAAAFEEARVTTAPVLPAFSDSSTVPVEVAPPATELAESETLVTF